MRNGLRRAAWIVTIAVTSAIGCRSASAPVVSDATDPAPTSGVQPDDAPTSSGAVDDDPSGGSTNTQDGVPDDGTSGDPPDELPLPLAYLRAEPYTRLVIELDAVAGLQLYPENERAIVAMLDELVAKPGGITIVPNDVLVPVGETHEWTTEQRAQLGMTMFDLEVPADTIKIHVMLVDGRPAADPADAAATLGHAWGNRHVMLYKSRIADACTGVLATTLEPVLCRRIELLLLQHELGHVLGLVDFGVPMQSEHRDPDHGPHDVDPACVMYWTYDGIDVVDAVVDELLTGTPPLQLDLACRDDLAAAAAG